MTVSRWKVMAGVLGVSLGGLAAIAGQCPRPDSAKPHRAEDPPAAEAPKVPPGGSGAAKPATPSLELPALPGSPAASPDATKLPSVPPPASGSGSAPSAPLVLPDSKPTEVKPPVVAPSTGPATGPSMPPITPAAGTSPVVPAPQVAPATPPAGPSSPPTGAPAGPPPTSIEFTKPAGSPTTPSTPLVAGPPPVPMGNPPAPMVSGPELVTPPPTHPVAANPPAVATATKFRIVLRVGEGEPAFEVRSGDDLVLKVACEKVDVKSPEKGQGQSAVIATGKVRFVGFGAEGTCDSLSFLAGTGEVSMNGNVKIRVKDKLGRIESELTTEAIKYKLDASTLPGTLKP